MNPVGDRIPKRFITTAFDICKRFVDSSLDCDPSADRPWVNGAILSGSAMTLRIGSRCNEVPAPAKVLSEGADGDGEKIRREYGIPDDQSKRQKFFNDDDKRRGFSFEKGRCYQFDFHNGYIDWKDYALKLPGFSLSVLKWINDRTHTVRFAMKNRKTGQQYLIVTFRLLFGDELKKALSENGKKPSSDETSASREVAGARTSASTSELSDQSTELNHSPRGEAYTRDAASRSQLTKTAEVTSSGSDSRTLTTAERRETQLDPGVHKVKDEDAVPERAKTELDQVHESSPSRKAPASTHDEHVTLDRVQESDPIRQVPMSIHNEHITPDRAKPQPHPNQESGSIGQATMLHYDEHSTLESASTEPEEDLGIHSVRQEEVTSSPSEGLGHDDKIREDASRSRGYRDSIEESLCQTASVDGRDKAPLVHR